MKIRDARWRLRLDTAGAVCGASVPIGLVIGSTGFEGLIILTTIFWILRSALTGTHAFRKSFSHPLAVPLAVWYGAILISLAWNGPGSKGWGHDIVIVRFGLFILAMLDISDRRPALRWMVWGLMAGVGFASINTIAAYLFGVDLMGNPLARYTLKLREAARIAHTSAYALPFFIGWGITDKTLSRRTRSLIISVGIVAGLQLMQTQIRTALLASVSGMLFLLAYHAKHRISARIFWGIILGLAVAVGLFFKTIGSLSLESMYDRIYYWKVSWAMWQDHPLLGVGISAWTDAYKELARTGAISAFTAPDGTIWQEGQIYHAHNLLLMLLSATGLLGTTAFTWLYIRISKLALSDQTGFRAGMAAWPVVLLGIGLTGFNIYSSSYLSLFAFLLAMMGYKQPREKQH